MATAPGGLSLVRMRQEFKDRMPDLLAGADYSDANVDEYLNGAHRYTMVAEVPGDLAEDIWQFETIVGKSNYPFRPDEDNDDADGHPIHVHSLDGPIFIDDYQIGSFRKPEWFFYYERPEDTGQSRPYSALIHGETLKLRPIPDAAYTVRAPGRIYPRVLTSDGIDYRPRALAVVCLAAAEVARRNTHTDLGRELEAEAGLYLDQTRAQSLSIPRMRVPRRSF